MCGYSMKTKIEGKIKDVKQAYCKIENIWKKVVKGEANIDGDWLPFFNEDVEEESSSIGSDELLYGDEQRGYYGIVHGDGEEFISPQQLFEQTDYSGSGRGRPISKTSIDWFKFSLDGKILFFPKEALAVRTQWTYLYRKGVVYGDGLRAGQEGAEHHDTLYRMGNGEYNNLPPTTQDRIIEIKGHKFIVRLIKSEEYDKLILPLHVGSDEWNPTASEHTPPEIPEWGSFSRAELGFKRYQNEFNSDDAFPVWVWCQESVSTHGNRIVRGDYYSSPGLAHARAIYAYPNPFPGGNLFRCCWRPILEWVPDGTAFQPYEPEYEVVIRGGGVFDAYDEDKVKTNRIELAGDKKYTVDFYDRGHYIGFNTLDEEDMEIKWDVHMGLHQHSYDFFDEATSSDRINANRHNTCGLSPKHQIWNEDGKQNITVHNYKTWEPSYPYSGDKVKIVGADNEREVAIKAPGIPHNVIDDSGKPHGYREWDNVGCYHNTNCYGHTGTHKVDYPMPSEYHMKPIQVNVEVIYKGKKYTHSVRTTVVESDYWVNWVIPPQELSYPNC